MLEENPTHCSEDTRTGMVTGGTRKMNMEMREGDKGMRGIK
jgi:hypothetical protein